MTKAATANLINQSVLGRYRIVRRLARGGMGAVYLARTEGAAGFARPVVIKRVLPSLMDDEEVAQMFVREAQILSNLQHPNIVSVVDFGQQDDGAYLMVLEYVNGYSLAEWHEFVMKERGTMPADLAIHIVTRVLDALHYAHTFKRSDGKALQIIHRDVTPSNVLLDVQGNVKLLDFGIARVSGDETAFLTDRSRVKGKLPYLPLETFKGEDPSVRSDVYSVGVVLYELLTGHNPFVGKETADIYLKVLEVVPPSVHATHDDAPEDIDLVLAKAMHKDATKRYASAAEFAQALRRTRSSAEEAIAERLAAQLRADFDSVMPERMGLETLGARERAWREAIVETNPDDAAADAAAFDLKPSNARPEQVTVRTDVAPELLAATSAASSTKPPEAPLAITARPPAGSPPSAADVVIAFEDDEPPRVAQEPTPLRPPSPTPGESVSLRRVVLVIGIAALVGAGAAAAVLMSMQSAPPPEEVVVIRQEANAALPPTAAAPVAAVPAAPALQPATAGQPAAPPETPPTAQAGAAALEPEKKAQRVVVANAPNAKSLTRIFGRRQSRVEACFTKHAASAPSHPEVSIHFWVDEKGAVTQAEVEPESVRGSALGRCLLEVAKTTSFGPMQRAVSFHIPITAERL